MNVQYYSEELYNNCGVKLISHFMKGNYLGDYVVDETPRRTGLIVAGFINNSICKEAYDILSSKYDIVYQSPIRRKQNGRLGYIFCVFQDRKYRNL